MTTATRRLRNWTDRAQAHLDATPLPDGWAWEVQRDGTITLVADDAFVARVWSATTALPDAVALREHAAAYLRSQRPKYTPKHQAIATAHLDALATIPGPTRSFTLAVEAPDPDADQGEHAAWIEEVVEATRTFAAVHAAWPAAGEPDTFTARIVGDTEREHPMDTTTAPSIPVGTLVITPYWPRPIAYGGPSDYPGMYQVVIGANQAIRCEPSEVAPADAVAPVDPKDPRITVAKTEYKVAGQGPWRAEVEGYDGREHARTKRDGLAWALTALAVVNYWDARRTA